MQVGLSHRGQRYQRKFVKGKTQRVRTLEVWVGNVAKMLESQVFLVFLQFR
jgi:hypothetical protein